MAAKYGSLPDDTTGSQAQVQTDQKLQVAVATSANQANVQGFITALNAVLHYVHAYYFQLPYNDIDNFVFRGTNMNTMILCHSIHNRRMAITDVLDALYDRFLPNASKALGKEKVCVIVHDMESSNSAGNYEEHISALRIKQPTTFECASLVMIGGKLDSDPVELQAENWNDLKDFLQKAATSQSQPIDCGNKVLSVCKKYWYIFLTILVVVIAAVLLGVLLSQRSSQPPNTMISSTTVQTVTGNKTVTFNYTATLDAVTGNKTVTFNYTATLDTVTGNKTVTFNSTATLDTVTGNKTETFNSTATLDAVTGNKTVTFNSTATLDTVTGNKTVTFNFTATLNTVTVNNTGTTDSPTIVSPPPG